MNEADTKTAKRYAEEKTQKDSDRRLSRWEGIAIDLLAVISFASLVYGCWLIYPAAGFIVGGGLGLIGALMIARSA